MRILGLTLGLLTGSITLYAIAPTEVKWDASLCKAGLATITTTASSIHGSYTVISEDVVLPQLEITQVFPNLPPTEYSVRATTRYTDEVFSSESFTITGLGDAPIPTPNPTPIPEPQLPPNCTAVASGQNSVGQWSFVGVTQGFGHVWLVTPDGVSDYAFPGGGALPGAAGFHFIFSNGIAYVNGANGIYYKLLGRNQAVQETPTCGTAPQVPSGDFKLLIDGISSANSSLLSILQLLAPQPTVTCSITAVSSYTNGDQRLTVRCAPSGFTTGQSIVIKK